MNLLLLAGLSSLSSVANASIPDLVGMGPSNISMGSASTALANDAYGAYYNPAGIGQARRITMAAAPILGQAMLGDFSGIVYDTNGDGLLQDTLGFPDYGPVGTDYRTSTDAGTSPFYTSGVQFGIVLPVWHVMAIGITGYLPSDALMRVSVADPSIPYYVMFADRNNRFAVSPALSIHPMQGLYLGVGAQVMAGIQADATLSTHANVSAFSSEEGAPAVDAQIQADIDQLDVAITPDLRLNGGLIIDASLLSKSRDPDKVTRLQRHAIGLSWRGVWLANTNAHVTANVTGQVKFDDETLLLSQLVEEPIALDIAGLQAFFNPPQAAFGLRTGFGDVRDGTNTLESTPRVQLTADATWTQWSSFQETTAPAMELVIESLEGVEMSANVGQDYGSPKFKDTISYRAGMQIATGSFLTKPAIQDMQVKVRMGAQWVPTPVPAQTGKTNYMDSDRVVGTGGLGFEIGRLAPFDGLPPVTQGPISLDIGGQYHYLLPRTQVKDEDLIQDSNGDGIPEYIQGYPLSGELTSYGAYWVVTAGLSMQLGTPQEHPRPIRSMKEGPVGFPQPAPEAVEPAGDAAGTELGEGESALAIPVNADGEPDPADDRKSRKERRAERKAAKAAAKAEGAEPVEGAEPAEGAEPVEGAEPAEGADTAAPAEGAEPAAEGAEPAAEEPGKKGRRGKGKKEKTAEEGAEPAEGAAPIEGAEGQPGDEATAPDAADPLYAPLDEPEPKAKKKEKKKKNKKGEEPPPAEDSLPESDDAGTPPTDDAGVTP